MFKQEKQLLEELTRDKDVLFFIILTLLSVMVRIAGRDFITGDFYAFLAWYDELKRNGGLAGLAHATGDYSVLFQTILAFLTYIPLPIVYLLKAIFAFFDYALAISAASVVCYMKKQKRFSVCFNTVYALVIFMPTVIINAAYWGQCDSIYTFFCMLTLLYLYKGGYKRAFLFLGIAFAFKLQAVFILPFVVCYYIWKKDFSILHFLISGAVFWVSGILAYIQGRNAGAAVDMYAGQATMFPKMWMNFTSFWMMFGNAYETFGPVAIFTALTVCGIGLYAIMSGYKNMASGESFLNTCVWFAWAMLLFLPEMHERYSFILDILLVMLCFFDVKYIKFAALSLFLSLISYGSFLATGNYVIGSTHAMVYTGAWLWYSYMIVKKDMLSAKPEETQQDTVQTEVSEDEKAETVSVQEAETEEALEVSE
jgi:Predicted integral membrane protein